MKISSKKFSFPLAKYKLDAESRKLRALESRGGPGLSAFERSEDATKGPQGALMRVVSMDSSWTPKCEKQLPSPLVFSTGPAARRLVV